MPARKDLKKILILGSGPIQIGQAAEFDYSGTQALKALKSEGYTVVLVNSNPATIMTDPELADNTYLEPLTKEFVREVIIKERPDALLPTLGGQTALNLAMDLYADGTLAEFNVELVGAGVEAIRKGEDRELFQAAMHKIGIETAKGLMVHTLEEAKPFWAKLVCPLLFVLPLPWVVQVAVLLTAKKNLIPSSAKVCTIRPLPAFWSKKALWAGKNTNLK